MDVEKAKERIKALVIRTEERGASPAEASTAAQMVCKLLTQFPEILGQPKVRQQRAETNRPPFPGNDRVSVRYRNILKTRDNCIHVEFDRKSAWLPLDIIDIKVSVIWMPLWIAQMEGLI